MPKMLTLADIEFIRDNYFEISLEEIVDALGTTADEVNRTVQQLQQRGIKMPKKKPLPRQEKNSR